MAEGSGGGAPGSWGPAVEEEGGSWPSWSCPGLRRLSSLLPTPETYLDGARWGPRGAKFRDSSGSLPAPCSYPSS